MEKRADEGETDRREPKGFDRTLPQLDDRTHLRMLGQAGVELRSISVLQNVHHMRPADPWWIIETGIVKPAPV